MYVCILSVDGSDDSFGGMSYGSIALFGVVKGRI